MKTVLLTMVMIVVLAMGAGTANAETTVSESNQVLMQWTIFTVPFELVAEEVTYSGIGKIVNLRIRAPRDRFNSRDDCSKMMSVYLNTQKVCISVGQHYYVYDAPTTFLTEQLQ